MFGPIQHLVFDFDGTLVDSMSSVLEGLGKAVANALGRTVSDEDLLASFGPAPQEVLQKWLPADKVDSAFQQWIDFEHSRQPEDFAPFAGVDKMLQELTGAGYSLGLFTGRDREGTLRIAGAHGWMEKYFTPDTIMCGNDGFRPKPHPEALVALLEKNSWDFSKTLMTGDHPYDIASGKEAGTKTAAVLWDAPKTKGTHRSKFRAGWQKWDTVSVDLRLASPESLTQWLVTLRAKDQRK